MRVRGRARLAAVAVFGVFLGFALSRIGFTDYDEIHRMFTFRDPRLFLTFGGACAFGAVGYLLLRGRIALPDRPIHRGTLVGGVLFGIGWVLSGACPGVVFAMLGEGRWQAIPVLLAVLVSARLYPRIHARWLRFDRNAC